jgi:hypothetical protein
MGLKIRALVGLAAISAPVAFAFWGDRLLHPNQEAQFHVPRAAVPEKNCMAGGFDYQVFASGLQYCATYLRSKQIPHAFAAVFGRRGDRFDAPTRREVGRRFQVHITVDTYQAAGLNAFPDRRDLQ